MSDETVRTLAERIIAIPDKETDPFAQFHRDLVDSCAKMGIRELEGATMEEQLAIICDYIEGGRA